MAKDGRSKPRTAKQKAATKRMLEARHGKSYMERKTSKKGSKKRGKKTVVRGPVGTKRKKGRVIGHVKPPTKGSLAYVTKNGTVIEAPCRNAAKGACGHKGRKKK